MVTDTKCMCRLPCCNSASRTCRKGELRFICTCQRIVEHYLDALLLQRQPRAVVEDDEAARAAHRAGDPLPAHVSQ